MTSIRVYDHNIQTTILYKIECLACLVMIDKPIVFCQEKPFEISIGLSEAEAEKFEGTSKEPIEIRRLMEQAEGISLKLFLLIKSGDLLEIIGLNDELC